ncbi:hypothetical protein AB0D67_18195 [Streptosporangium sp. NPDC048047]|uniref:hypothetical protein n=1 Tax=Streptosporangium sp. NPDC048047 TaxID=3155748 RepID=UPI00342B5D50
MQRVVVDPEVPAEVAELFRRNARLLSRVRAGWQPAPVPVREDRRGIAPKVRIVILSGVLLGLLAMNIGRIPFFLIGMLAFVALIGTIAAQQFPDAGEGDEDGDAGDYEISRHAHWYEGRYLLPEDFDDAAGPLLERAGRAVDTVMRSRINALGMLDDVRNSVMLPAEEWQIARLLAKLSALRGEHRDLLYGGSTPEVAAAMAPLERALAASEAAVVARVEALERYARHVTEAERALRAHEQIEQLRERLPRYEELLAETGADSAAVPEIDRLAGDAGRLERALRDSVRSAHEAFRHLDGPPGDGPSVLG